MKDADEVNGDDEEYSPDQLVQQTEGEDDADGINNSRTEGSMMQVSKMQHDHSSDLIKNINLTTAEALRQRSE